MPPLKIELDYDRGVPIYRQITDAVLAALSTGGLAREEQLPTIHELARQLGVNPNTVARSYRDLERDGHIFAKRGRGTFPASTPPAQPTTTAAARTKALKQLFERTLAEGARVGLDAPEIVSYFQKALNDRS